jgi:hypothetical protein
MSRKHNTKHLRSPSNYWRRLQDRGESSASVRMPFIDGRGRKHDTPQHEQAASARERASA